MDDLKSIVAHALEKKGVMAKIRAELRAHVFQAIEEQEGSSGLRASSSGDLSSQARRLANMTSSPQASLLLDLVKEFLDFYELDYTSQTMAAEAKLGTTGSSSPTALKDRATLATAARLQAGPSDERPLLLDLLLQAQGLSTASNIVPAASAHSGSSRAGGLPTHSPASSYELTQQRDQPQSHSAPQPESFDLDSPQSHPRSSGPSRRSGDGDHASKYSISPPAAAASSGAPASPSTPTSNSASSAGGHNSLNITLSGGSTQPAPVSPTTDANGNPTGPSSRRRRDRNLDMAAVRQEVHTTTGTAPAAATPASSHSSSSTKLSALPSLALNKSAPLPPVDVPLIELDPSSDLDASGELQSQPHSRHPQSRGQHASSSSFDGEESMDGASHGGGLATSVELDQQRVAEIDRLLKSYQAQGVAPGPGQGAAGTNISSSTSSAQPSASQSRMGSAAQSRDNYDGLNTSGAPSKSRAQPQSASAGGDEDEYGDEEFAASDVGARSAEADAIEESLEVDVDAGPEEDSSLSPLKVRDSGRPTTAGSMQQDDSLDAEYFNSNSSLVEQSHGGRKQQSAPLGRRAQIPPSIHSASHSDHDASQSELDASASYDDNPRAAASKSTSAAATADRDPLDVYSEDQSVHDPLEDQFDYTEEVEPVV